MLAIAIVILLTSETYTCAEVELDSTLLSKAGHAVTPHVATRGWPCKSCAPRHPSRIKIAPVRTHVSSRSHMVCLSADAHDASGIVERGMLQASEGDLSGAVKSFRAALELEPQRAETHHQLGLALAKEGDLLAANESFQRVLELEPQRATLTSAELLAPGSERVQVTSSAVPKVDVDHKVDTLLHCGTIQMKFGDLTEAEASFKSVLDIDPTNADALKQLDVIEQKRRA
eukprot:gnl/TRDRNA2_/TRDRNA2_80272_c0_seq1.p1 gnl/TRDRNA2_/TRDRNA2_80272_c0~~gnl/TRDRNA2_/TRDRNA2_80272_c0_seq1.p1  ORF type:complete len:230 (-),score=47.24 gnl/TRDRNA2_/TRDRNA2_80272_c0_seq1:9-698(-)